MANSYLYPRKTKKFKKTKIVLTLIILIGLLLTGFYLYKTKIKNETMIIQSPILFTSTVKTEEKGDKPVNLSQTTTFKDIQLSVKNKQLIQNQQNGAEQTLLTYDVTINNNSKKTIQFEDTDFTLVQDGTRYNGKMDNLTGADEFVTVAIKPQESKTHSIAFSIQPDIATSTHFELMISNTNWDNQQATIQLKD